MVLLVRHTKLQRRNVFALKLLKPELSKSPDFRRRFLREAEIVYSFSHPNIVPIREFGETDEGELYFTMDFCRGQPLDKAMKGGSSFPLARVLKITDDVLQGLGFAHSHSIVHRDLKPGNIFLEQGKQGETAKLLDFGIAKPNDKGAVELTCGEKILGTPHYMAPEQILGKKLDGRADLYALGVVLYRVLAAKPPFNGRTGHEILTKHLRDQPVPLKKLKPEIPAEVSALVQRLLSKHPGERPESAEELRCEVTELRARFCGDGSPLRVRRKKRGRRASVFLLAACALVAAAFFFVSGYLNKDGEKAEAAFAVSSPLEPDDSAAATVSVRARMEAETGKQERSECAFCGASLSDEEIKSGEGLCAECLKHAKWCRFCKKKYPADKVTCPDCGQFLVPYLRAKRVKGMINRAINRKRLRKAPR